MRKTISVLLCLLLLCVPVAGRCQEVDLAPTPTPAPIALTPLSQAPLLETPPLHPACAAVLLAEADSHLAYDAWNHIKRPERFGGIVVLPTQNQED